MRAVVSDSASIPLGYLPRPAEPTLGFQPSAHPFLSEPHATEGLMEGHVGTLAF